MANNKYLLKLTDNKINILNKFGTIFNNNYTITGDISRISNMDILKMIPISTKFKILFWSPVLDYKHPGILSILSELFKYSTSTNGVLDI